MAMEGISGIMRILLAKLLTVKILTGRKDLRQSYFVHLYRQTINFTLHVYKDKLHNCH